MSWVNEINPSRSCPIAYVLTTISSKCDMAVEIRGWMVWVSINSADDEGKVRPSGGFALRRLALAPPISQPVENGQHDENEHGGGEHSAHDDTRQRLLRLSADA